MTSDRVCECKYLLRVRKYRTKDLEDAVSPALVLLQPGPHPPEPPDGGDGEAGQAAGHRQDVRARVQHTLQLGTRGYHPSLLELETKVHPKVRITEKEGPY